MGIKIKLKRLIKVGLEEIRNWYNYHFNTLAITQRKNHQNIPVIINNYNQLTNLKHLVNWLEKRNFKKIIILDNKSSYPPLIEWYKHCNHEIIFLNENLGHTAFWSSKEILEKYVHGYFILTDPDILPSDECPPDFLNKLIDLLYLNPQITKTGFALQIDDIPDHYIQKEKVLNWERKFWNNALGKDIHLAYIDTTFALYRPNHNYKRKFYDGIRLSGKYTCKHTSWYWDYANLTQEQKNYVSMSNCSSQWSTNRERLQF
jgi:hypothetical protein